MGSHQQLNFFDQEPRRIPVPPAEAKERSQLPFVSLSTLIHILMVIAAITIESPLFQPKTETITVELQDSPPLESAVLQQTAKENSEVTTTNTDVAEPNAAPVVVAKTPPAIEPVAVAKPLAQPTKEPTKPAMKKDFAKKASLAPIKQSGHVEKGTVSEPADIPTSVDEVATAPDLDESSLAADTMPTHADAASVIDEANDYKKIDQTHAQEAVAAENELNNLNNQVAQEQDSLADQVASANDQQEQNLQAALTAKKAQYGAALKAAAEDEAKSREAAAAASAAKSKASQSAMTQVIKGGVGGNGNGKGTIRGLDQLKQMPGNPTPHYSSQERYLGQSGKVVFLAYVDKSGVPVDFRQTASTGYPNLDTKTLEALKKWKFYPGQEGWVEIPFRWDLQGGPQEARAIKR